MTERTLDGPADIAPSGETLDTELNAIQVVLGALRGLKPDERQRVVNYVFQRLGLSPSSAVPSEAPSAIPVSTLATSESPSTVPRDIRSLKEQKKPRTAMEMAALVAYYLSELAPQAYRKTEIGTEDINTFFKQADFPLPTIPRQTLFNAKAAGYFDSAGRGAFKLNPVGHNLVVHGLPAAAGEAAPRAARNRGAAKKGARGTRKRR